MWPWNRREITVQLVPPAQKPDWVDQYYMMNPETEIILFDGEMLRDGMVVLIESPIQRADTSFNSGFVPKARYANQVKNRWCTVSDLRKTASRVSFIGIYEDGTKVKREYDKSLAWLVKLDSLEADQ